MATKKKESRHLLGAPWNRFDRDDFEASIIERHAWDEKGGMDRAVDYAYKLVDRQINKARGLLTYNALLFAAFRAIRPATGPVSRAITFGALSALISCFPLLLMMYVAWGTRSNWKTSKNDFNAVCSVIYRRSYLLTTALVISGIATAIAVLEVLTTDHVF
jgi:hypothetical protein